MIKVRKIIGHCSVINGENNLIKDHPFDIFIAKIESRFLLRSVTARTCSSENISCVLFLCFFVGRKIPSHWTKSLARHMLTTAGLTRTESAASADGAWNHYADRGWASEFTANQRTSIAAENNSRILRKNSQCAALRCHRS